MRLIDADALIFALVTQDYSGSPESLEDWTPQDITKAEITDIEHAPTIDAEPVRYGKWIECESENGIHFHKCSECGKRDMYQGTFTDWNKRGFSFYYKRLYCPVCGAKMDLEE